MMSTLKIKKRTQASNLDSKKMPLSLIKSQTKTMHDTQKQSQKMYQRLHLLQTSKNCLFYFNVLKVTLFSTPEFIKHFNALVFH